MQQDIRETALYREAEALCKALRQPGTGQVSDAAEAHVAPDGRAVVFAATLVAKLEGALQTRICRIDLASADMKVITFGPNSDRLPKYSPDGQQVAFLSDRHGAGDFQLYLLDLATGGVRAMPRVEGWVEYLHWSPDGRRILLGVAGHGADVPGPQGAVSSEQIPEDVETWMPSVETGRESFRWRRAWTYDLATNSVRQVSPPNSNIWEAVWCGDQTIAALESPRPQEGMWYGARLHLIDLLTIESREIFAPSDQRQLGWVAASASGAHVAVVEAICSDRGLVAGDLRLIEIPSGKVRHVDTAGVDITYTEWRSNQRLLLAGHRGFETVIAVHDIESEQFKEVWKSEEITSGGRYISVSGFGDQGDCVLVGESFTRAPELAVIEEGRYRSVKSFDLGYAEHIVTLHAAEPVRWSAPDNLEIQGWLLRPKGSGPHPLIMNVHGGPIWHWRPRWLGRQRDVPILMLLKRGYAIFFPNPRGSAGRGQLFARAVLGDMGGADTDDYLSGLDHLVEQAVADPNRLGVMGGSYGGFMTSWLITQDSRFAAAVAVVPITNYVSEHLISNIPQWVSLFLADDLRNPTGRYFQRSPIMHAHRARTPTLNIAGALDRCTPAEEAVQFHNALRENGVESVLAVYPEEGHGIRRFPAAIDYAARVVSWFDTHIADMSLMQRRRTDHYATSGTNHS